MSWIEIRRSSDSMYDIVRDGAEVLGRAPSEQEALVLACASRRQDEVWLIEAHTGRRVAVDCPVHSPLENFEN